MLFTRLLTTIAGGEEFVAVRVSKTPSATVWEEVRSLGSYVLLDMQSDGTLLARDSQRLWKSTDEAANWAVLTYQLPNNTFFPSPIIAARVMGDGNVVVWCYNGNIYRSNANTLDTGFTQVGTTVNNPGKTPTNAYGTFVYNQYAMYNEYGNEPANNAHYSNDYGATWINVLTLPTDAVPADQNHMHNVAYDQYDDMLWVVNGDMGNRMIWYSLDQGTTWTQLCDFGEFGSIGNMIQVIPLPECILLLTDDDLSGAYKLRRRRNPNQGYTIDDLELAYKVATVTGSLPVGTRPVIQYGDDACCYFSFEFYSSSQSALLSHIYATRDGVAFYDIAQSSYTPTGSGAFGVSCLMGPASNGYIYGQHSQGAGRYLIRFAAPTWS
ncbi:MAG: hypothetical protein IT328_23815 [Caldilineaceae bacterium]|nr:hypothetical protein [Caldilineaceae bacterium]